jgi:hypothetical protein
MKSKINEFDSLVSKALDSNISDSEAVHLKELLSNNKNLQRRYCSFVRNESLMHWEQSFQAVETENKLFQFPNLSYVATIAAVFICLASAWLAHSYRDIAPLVQKNQSPLASNISENLLNIPAGNMVAGKTSIRKEAEKSSKFLQSSVSEKTANFIRILETKQSVFVGGILSLQDGLPYIKSDEHLSTAATSGVLPIRDDNMMQFPKMTVDAVSKTAEVSETVRVYDLGLANLTDKTVVDASIHFNQSFSSLSDSTEFSLSLHAIENHESGSLEEIGTISQTIVSDNDQSTWERADTNLPIPHGTDFLVVSLKAKKFGTNAFIAHQHNFFADELELSFSGI